MDCLQWYKAKLSRSRPSWFQQVVPVQGFRNIEMRRRKVLLAIRHSDCRAEFRQDLIRNGFDVVTADHGLDCLQVFQAFAPDVIVIDPELQWGGGDGVLDVIRDDPRLSEVPVLALTTTRNRAVDYCISQLSISDFWVHPITPGQLTERVSMLACHGNWRSISEFDFTLVSGANATRNRTADDHRDLPGLTV